MGHYFSFKQLRIKSQNFWFLRLDEAVGNITNKLEELGLLDDTLIFFMSDNGAQVNQGGRNYPLRGAKMTPFEGGHRVRAFISGSNLKPYVNEGMFHSVDWLPTILNGAIQDAPVGKLLDHFEQKEHKLNILSVLKSLKESMELINGLRLLKIFPAKEILLFIILIHMELLAVYH